MIPHIIDQHFENVSAVLPSLLLGTTYTNDDLAGTKNLQSTFLANLDGLKISGSDGRAHILSELTAPDLGEIFALGCWALLDENKEWWQNTLDLANNNTKALPALVEALDLLDIQYTKQVTDSLIQKDDSALRWLGLEARLRQRRPLDPKTWTEALKSQDASIRANAFSAIGIFKEMRLAKALSHGINDKDSEVRYQALRSAALLGDARVAPQLQSIALSESPFAYEALDTVCRLLSHRQVVSWIQSLVSDPAPLRGGIEAAGILGDAAAMPFILRAMEDEVLSRIAAEAFIRITGLDFQDEKLEQDAPEGWVSGPNDDPDDDDVDMDLDDDLPWPDHQACTHWYSINKGQFRPGIRYLLGQPLDQNRLIYALKHDNLKYRHGHAAQLLFNQDQGPLFPTKASASRQLALLANLI